MSNYKFETLQLHVGQEQPDPRSDDAVREENEESGLDFYSLLKNRSRNSNDCVCNPISS